MPYPFRLKPKTSQGLTLADYATRFLATNLRPIGTQEPGCVRLGIANVGHLVVKVEPEKDEPYAEARISLTTLGWDANEIRPRVDVWLRVAEQTDSIIFDGHTMDVLEDEASIVACVERIVAKRRACFKGGSVWVRKDLES
jgi:hypothetical protein